MQHDTIYHCHQTIKSNYIESYVPDSIKATLNYNTECIEVFIFMILENMLRCHCKSGIAESLLKSSNQIYKYHILLIVHRFQLFQIWCIIFVYHYTKLVLYTSMVYHPFILFTEFQRWQVFQSLTPCLLVKYNHFQYIAFTK